MSKTRKPIESEIQVHATPEEVWKALTDAQELTRWFPLKSEVTPGVGGTIRLLWDEVWDGNCPIEIWEPNVHLRTRWFEKAQPFEDMNPATPIAVDYYIEGQSGGTTKLRVVTSGFSADQSWDAMYDSVSRGWHFELRSMQRYFEHHKGKDRVVAWSRRRAKVSPDEAWRRLCGPDFLNLPADVTARNPGDALDFTTASGERFTGAIEVLSRPKDFAMLATNLDHAILRIHLDEWTHDEGKPFTEAFLWLARYDASEREMKEIEQRWNARFDELFPEPVVAAR